MNDLRAEIEAEKPFLTLDHLIEQLKGLKEIYASVGRTDLRVAVSVVGAKPGFSTPYVATATASKLIGFEGDYVLLIASHPDNVKEYFGFQPQPRIK